MLSLSRRTFSTTASLLLEQYAKRENLPKLSQQLSEYIEAKKQYDVLLDKYAVFQSKEKSVSDTAKLVGLKVPRSSSNQ
jgi:hypothetical protein